MRLRNSNYTCTLKRRACQRLKYLCNRTASFCNDIQDYKKAGKTGDFKKLSSGTNGGYCLNRALSEISLYDICASVDPDILLLECMKKDYHCSMNSQQNHVWYIGNSAACNPCFCRRCVRNLYSNYFSDNFYTRKMCQAYFSVLIFTILVKF